MSYIQEIAPEQADGKVKQIYERFQAAFNGRLPPVMSVMSLNPRAMEAVHEMGHAISFGGSSLGQRREEMIATYVSTLNRCHY